MKNKYLFFNFLGLFSGLTWAVNTVIVGLSMKVSPLNEKSYFHITPFISNFFNDFFVFIIILTTIIVLKKTKNITKLLFSKNGLLLIISGILGGPLGMLFYMFGVHYCGASLTSTISSTYPVIGTILSFLFLSERLTKKNYIGILLIMSGILFLYFNPKSGIHNSYYVGFLFSFLAALGWGIQGVFLKISMKNKEISKDIMLLITVGTALFCDIAIILPYEHAIKIIPSLIFSHSGYYGFIAAMFGAFSTWIYYISIDKIGVSKSMALDITYGLWAFIISALFLHHTFSTKMIFCSAIILLGVIFSIKGGELKTNEKSI